MPAGAPVIDFLAVVKYNPEGWAYPLARLVDVWCANYGIANNYPINVEKKEIVIS